MIEIENDNNISQAEMAPLKNSLGERLKNAREAKSLSIKEAATHLHLSIKIINIIENEQFSEGPPPTFMRGYLRSYARFLNIPDHEISKTLETLEIPISIKSIVSPILHTRPTDQTNRYLYGMTYLIIFVLLIMVGLWWHSHQRYTMTESIPTSNNTAPSTNTTPPKGTTSSNIGQISATKSTAPLPANTLPASNNSTVPLATDTSPASNSTTVPLATDTPPASNSTTVPLATDTPPASNNTAPLATDTPPASNSTNSLATDTLPASNESAPLPTEPSTNHTAGESTTADSSAAIVTSPQVDTPPIISATSTSIDSNPTQTSVTPPADPPTSPQHKHRHKKPAGHHATLPGMPNVNMALPEPG